MLKCTAFEATLLFLVGFSSPAQTGMMDDLGLSLEEVRKFTWTRLETVFDVLYKIADLHFLGDYMDKIRICHMDQTHKHGRSPEIPTGFWGKRSLCTVSITTSAERRITRIIQNASNQTNHSPSHTRNGKKNLNSKARTLPTNRLKCSIAVQLEQQVKSHNLQSQVTPNPIIHSRFYHTSCMTCHTYGSYNPLVIDSCVTLKRLYQSVGSIKHMPGCIYYYPSSLRC